MKARQHLGGKLKSPEKIIKEQLEQTRKCKFKSAVVNCIYKKGWTCVNIKIFAKELAKKLK